MVVRGVHQSESVALQADADGRLVVSAITAPVVVDTFPPTTQSLETVKKLTY